MQNDNEVEKKGRHSLSEVKMLGGGGDGYSKFFSSGLNKIDSKPKSSSPVEDPLHSISLPDPIRALIWAYACGGDFTSYSGLAPANSLLWDIFFGSESDTQKILISGQIQKGNLSFLYGNGKVLDFLDFKQISSLKAGNFPLILYLMNCAQSNLIKKYLNNAEQKKIGIKEKVAAKIAELKVKGYRRPVELRTQVIPCDMALSDQDILDCERLLGAFKKITERDFFPYVKTLSLEQRKFIELYLNIMLSNEDQWRAYMESSGGFDALMLTPLDDFRVNLGSGDQGFQILDPDKEEKINGLTLLVKIGNLRILEVCREHIKSLISAADLNTESMEGRNGSINLGKVLAANPENEAVLQFLFEQGAAGLQKNLKYYRYFSLLYSCASGHYDQSLLLAIAWGVHVESSFCGRTPLLEVFQKGRFQCSSAIILLAAGAEIDRLVFDKTILEDAVRTVFSYLRVRNQTNYQRAWQECQDLMLLLLAAGADPSKLKSSDNIEKFKAICKAIEGKLEVQSRSSLSCST